MDADTLLTQAVASPDDAALASGLAHPIFALC